jgi:hypothetical protein
MIVFLVNVIIVAFTDYFLHYVMNKIILYIYVLWYYIFSYFIKRRFTFFNFINKLNYLVENFIA